MQVSFSSADIVGITQPLAIRGETSEVIRGLASLAAAAPGDLSFLGNPKYKSEVPATRASVVLLPVGYSGEPLPGQLFLLVENPSVALARVCARIERLLWPAPLAGVHPSAVVAPGAMIAPTATIGPLCVVEAGAQIGERVHLQAQVFVGREARIGDDSWLMPGVVLASECVLGRRVRVQPGAVIGSDGFGYEFSQGRHEKVLKWGTSRSATMLRSERTARLTARALVAPRWAKAQKLIT